MRKTTKCVIRLYIVPSIIIAAIILHTTPSLAIRTRLFFDCHPIAAINTKVEVNEFQQSLDKEILEKEGSRIYCISAKAKDWQTGNYIVNYKVTKNGHLYYVHSYGEC